MTAASSATGGKTMVYNTILDMEGESDNEETKDEISFIQICTFVCLALALIMDNASYYMKEPFFPVVVSTSFSYIYFLVLTYFCQSKEYLELKQNCLWWI